MLQSLHAAPEPGGVAAGRRIDAARVERIVAGDQIEHERVVAHGARERTDMIERERERHHAAPADETVRAAFMPTTPHIVAGLRIEPPVSVPIAAGTKPAAVAAPEPLDEPPQK